MVSSNIDVLFVSETKIDDNFPVNQFCGPGYSVTFSHDHTGNGRGIILYTLKNIYPVEC